MRIALDENDLKELKELYREAQTTPVIGFSVRQMVEGRDLASQAWGRVRKRMDELGKKYGFDPSKIQGIEMNTGEVLLEVA